MIKVKTQFFYILAWPAKIIYLLYAATIELRTTTVNSRYHPRNLASDFNAIYVFWHSKLFMIMPMGRNSHMGVLTLLDWKNFFYDKLCRFFRYRTISVTGNSSAARKLKEMVDDGFSIALAVDGPAGPAGVVKTGAIYLAQKTKKPIITVDIKFAHSIRLRNRWDKFEIPFPFTRTTLIIGDPIDPNGRSIEEIRAEIKMRLDKR